MPTECSAAQFGFAPVAGRAKLWPDLTVGQSRRMRGRCFSGLRIAGSDWSGGLRNAFAICAARN